MSNKAKFINECQYWEDQLGIWTFEAARCIIYMTTAVHCGNSREKNKQKRDRH